MKSFFLLVSVLLAFLSGPRAGGVEELARWVPGSVVSDEALQAYGVDRCFASCPLDSAIMSRIGGRSWKEGVSPAPGELRYLKVLHRNADGEPQLGEMICNRAISDDLLYIFRCLFDAGYRIERMVLVDEYDADDDASMAADNSSCFNTRFIYGTTRLSKHGLGMAVDINPLYNPYVKRSGEGYLVLPAAGRPYAFDRESRTDIPYEINRDDLCLRLFLERGFTWGGDWKSLKDYQHFEK